jgi:hypothetical protein
VRWIVAARAKCLRWQAVHFPHAAPSGRCKTPEQNLRLALSVGDVFLVLSRGKVVFRGARAEVQETSEIIGDHLGIGQVKRFSQWHE